MLKLSADGSSGKTLWKNSDLDNRMGGVVLLNGKIYGMGDKKLKDFTVSTGKRAKRLHTIK
ncbi:MAG: hypothetical protein U0Z17_11855 [Bacteroidales bacterium]